MVIPDVDPLTRQDLAGAGARHLAQTLGNRNCGEYRDILFLQLAISS